ncbi:MAG TPA: hypothetical protein VE991_09390, partial [Acidimicrobiales bacterium]|nr:hypothetical protein [Acidimicrobiales bacterium]
AKVMSTTVVNGSDSAPCLPDVTALQARGVVALAVAGSPTLAASCMAALSVTGWTPAGGVLLPPSAAYGNVTASPQAFTVLGLPWPESSSAGAARFRAAAPGITSYRALVSFAAVELAVDVARSVGAPTMANIAGGTWHNDLFDFAGLNNAGAQVVEGGPSGWVPAP